MNNIIITTTDTTDSLGVNRLQPIMSIINKVLKTHRVPRSAPKQILVYNHNFN